MKVVSDSIQRQMAGSSWIRKMFEKGIELKKQFGAENVYDFSLGNPDIAPPAKIREVMCRLSETVSQPLGLGYCPNAGLPAFRETLAKYLSKQQQVEVPASNIVCTVGAAGAITSFFRAVLEPGDELICPAPYFVEYGSYCGHFGGVLKPIPAKPLEFQPDIDAMERAITEKTRVILINAPNNPTGCVYSQETMNRLAEMVERVNENRERPVFLLSDEPYRFLTYDGVEVPPVLPLTKFAILLGSFSKNLSLAGERVGFVCINPALPDAQLLTNAVILTNRTLGFVNAPVIGQRIAMELIDEEVDKGVYTRRRDALATVLTEAGIRFAMPKGTFYFFPEVPGGDDLKFVDALLQHNVLAVPGSGFGFKGHIRLSFSTVDESVIMRSASGFRKAVEQIG
ncbi:MAG: pyridoxal phosphate-dependent aminotransferase [Kiritimatiellae bacterium]|nr:pyridoxal phosphate-dependent aminotransferase [Kiritimatiellia bacterium]